MTMDAQGRMRPEGAGRNQAVPIDAATHYTDQAKLALFDEMRDLLRRFVHDEQQEPDIREVRQYANCNAARALLARVDQL